MRERVRPRVRAWHGVRLISMILAFVLLLNIYLLMPVMAALYELGDARGPKIYPRSYHERVYTWGRNLTDSGWSPPREYGRDRPWFYGSD